MILEVKSTNPNLSYIIKKNPQTGMTIKSYRKGNIFGWFNNDFNYLTLFKDGADEVSMGSGDGEYDYNDSRKYDCPTIVMGIINEFFSDLIKPQVDQYDTKGFETTVTVHTYFMYDTKYFNILTRYYPHIKANLEQVGNKIYKVELTTTGTIEELIKVLYVITTLYHSKGDTFITEHDISKYIGIMNHIDAPYFIKYVFKTNYIFGEKSLSKYSEELVKNNRGQEYKFVVGNTHAQRMDFILGSITCQNSILDFGCGDTSSYGIRLIKQQESDSMYYAVDIDEKVIEESKRLVSRKVKDRVDNVVYSDNVNDLVISERVDVVMSEIFEHIKLKHTEKVLKKIFTSMNWGRIIITTPNREFNDNYLLDDNLRLDDHVFEMDGKEFVEYFENFLKKYNVDYDFHNIGDSVNGITPTQAIIIRNKKQ